MSNLAVTPINVVKGELVISDADVATIDKAYQPAIDKMLELAPKVVECFEMEKGDEKTKLAKSLYTDYVKIRTTTHREIHKVEKAKYTAQGKYCDLHKRTRDEIGDPIEAKLKEIRDEAKIEKEKNMAELQTLRENELSAFLEPTAEMIPDLGKMNDVVWAALLAGAKSTFDLNNRIEKDETDLAKEKADYQAETMRRYNLLMPLQRFVTDENKRTYAELKADDFNAILLEAQTLSDEAAKELVEVKEAVKVLEEKVETVTQEKEVLVEEKAAVVEENKSFNDVIQEKAQARRPDATDKEKMTAFVLDLRTVIRRYEYTDPKFVDVSVKSNNYLTQLINNIEAFNI